MTNTQKAELRGLVRAPNPLPVKTIAEIVDCSPATVRKYARIFAKGPK